MDKDIHVSYHRCLFFSWWEQWHFLLFGSYVNFCSKIVMRVEGSGSGFYLW